MHGQDPDLQTDTDLNYNDFSKQISESNTDIETAYEPLQQPPSEESDIPSTLDIILPSSYYHHTTRNIPQIKRSRSRGGKCNLRPHANPDYSVIYRY